MTTLALFRDNQPLVVVGFFNYDGINIEGAIAAAEKKRWANRKFIERCFRYVFQENGCRRMTVRVEEGNDEALKLDLGLGFVHEGTLRKASQNGKDVHILGMLKEECRWINGMVDRLHHQGTDDGRAGSLHASSGSSAPDGSVSAGVASG